MSSKRRDRKKADRKDKKVLTQEEKDVLEKEETTADAADGVEAESEDSLKAAATDGGGKDSENPEAKKDEGGTDSRDEKIIELTDQYKRTLAEFDNFRKRTEKEKAARFDMGIRSFAERILPVVDNFERGIGALSEEQKEEAFAAGMIATYKQMTDILEQIGIVPIEALGKTFNPELHNAVMHVEDDSAEDNIIVEEFQKGYTYNGAVVRYSMVKVAN